MGFLGIALMFSLGSVILVQFLKAALHYFWKDAGETL